ncbi:DUF393 domain-containing protein [Marinovum sp.]|uniref:thiol-disulfide oxidoreductase DCC family protein n=1 Tax=Marinovum sp. TaxID=2024839 RepID=UPI002B278B98|nr:DUF393 domain-containing protein [Marinovum sp.]
MSDPAETRALYNSDCPVCDAEMCSYAAYSEARGLPIAFDDLNRIELDRWGVSEDAATRLLHVLHRGELHIGFDAMLVLWDQMPRYRWLARLGRLPGVYPICDWIYAQVVARWIYLRHQRRKARGLLRKT